MKKITLLMCLLVMSFANAQYATMAIVGDGTGPGGWPGEVNNPGPTDVKQMTSTDGIHWTYENLTTYNGSVKFRAENSWNNNWGSAALPGFPSGTGVHNSPTNITTPGGIYNVTFNSTTLAYTFTASNLYPTISLVGPAVGGPDVWDVDFDLGTTDGVVYSATNVHLFAGAVKWRQNHDWMAANWGPGTSSYPSGTAVLNDPGAVTIPSEGNYNVSFNKTTLAYSFSFPTVALVGNATPGGWPDGPSIDSEVMSTEDGVTYTINSIAITAGLDNGVPPSARGMKFRSNNSWNQQWGASTTPGFPSGIGTQGGNDIIPDVSGNYSVTLNVVTGAYNFGAPLAVSDFNKSALKAYPNPTSNNWNFNSANETIQNISIVDISGKTVFSVSPKSADATIDASALTSGMYFAKVSTATATSTLKLIKR